jgi:hypothetical protein
MLPATEFTIRADQQSIIGNNSIKFILNRMSQNPQTVHACAVTAPINHPTNRY